jgi:hypothetical protein
MGIESFLQHQVFVIYGRPSFLQGFVWRGATVDTQVSGVGVVPKVPTKVPRHPPPATRLRRSIIGQERVQFVMLVLSTRAILGTKSHCPHSVLRSIKCQDLWTDPAGLFLGFALDKVSRLVDRPRRALPAPQTIRGRRLRRGFR